MKGQYFARWVVSSSQHVLPRAGLAVGADGRVAGHLAGGEASTTEGTPDEQLALDLGEVVLLPGYVNGHAHLELPALGAQAPREFLPWIDHVLKRRCELQASDYEACVRKGATRLLRTGTTAVGDVDSSGASTRLFSQLPLRGRIYREVLDGDDAVRTPSELQKLRVPWPQCPGLEPGVSPHAPHTVSDHLLRAVAQEAKVSDLAISTHWAESPEECAWLREGRGAFSSFFKNSPGCSGLERLGRAGLLGGALSLVHGNHPEAGDLKRLAGEGVSLVHCPGSHAYFGRPKAAVEEWVRLDLPVALGTDSLASNEDLDMGREMSILRREHPALEAARVFDWATRGGARALAMEQSIGDLSVGKWADFIALDASGMETEADVFDLITSKRPAVLGVWIAGRQVWRRPPSSTPVQ